MAIRQILKFPNPILSQPSKVSSINLSHLKSLIKDLTDTLYHSPGVGLAAPQIGVLERISVIDVGRPRGDKKHIEKSTRLIILINPVLLLGKGQQTPREGCLSVPDLLANVRRYEFVKVKTQTLQGKTKIIKAKGFEALALQHEIDHLNGKLFLDRVLNLKTDVFRRKTY